MREHDLFNQTFGTTNASSFPHSLARTTDCDESKAAGFNSVNFSGKHRERILSALVKPMGKDAIANATGLTSVQVDRRLHELHKAGLIEPTGAQGEK